MPEAKGKDGAKVLDVDFADFNILSLASGSGMLDEGVKLALELLGCGSTVSGYCEWETCAAASLLARMEEQTLQPAPIWCGDLREFAATQAGEWRGCVDILTAGYPCQPFSQAGKRAGSKDARHLWPAVRRTVARVKPPIVFFENVDGHVTMGLWKVVRDCERLGYRTTAGVFSAEEVGAPHLRKRVFILGMANAGCGDGVQSDANQRQGGNDAGGLSEELGYAELPGVRIESGISKAGERRARACDGHDELANKSSQRWREAGKANNNGRPADMPASAYSELANSQSRRCGTMRESSECDGRSERGDIELGDTESEHRPRGISNAGPSQIECGRTGDELGDPKLCGQRESGRCSTEGPNQRFGLFPPGRTDYQRWAELATSGVDSTLMPAIESGVSVVANGLASPADLLRLGGNGVVPVQAGWAFLSLLACLMEPVAPECDEPTESLAIQKHLFSVE